MVKINDTNSVINYLCCIYKSWTSGWTSIRSLGMIIWPYIPTYTRTDITDALHGAFGFRTDYQITSQKNMRKILNQTKKK